MTQAGTVHRPVYRDKVYRGAGSNGDADDRFARAELPNALSYLARQCPRDYWPAADLDEIAKDWLFKHDWRGSAASP